MPFIDWAQIEVNELAPGIRLRAPYGQHLMLSLLEMDEGTVIPLHQHPHEQAGVLLSGQMELTIGEETRIVKPGEAYLIPGGTPHRAAPVGGPATTLDIFSPIREDYAALGNKYIPEVGRASGNRSGPPQPPLPPLSEGELGCAREVSPPPSPPTLGGRGAGPGVAERLPLWECDGRTPLGECGISMPLSKRGLVPALQKSDDTHTQRARLRRVK